MKRRIELGRYLIIIGVVVTVFGVRVSLVSAETPSVRGKLKYDGEVLWKLSRVEPRFWFRNEDTGKVAGGAAKYEEGTYEVYGLGPGNFGMAINVDLNPENPSSYPGDLRAFRRFSVNKGQPTRLDVDLTKLIHLTKPEDNGEPIPNWGARCTDKTSFKGELRFAWEPIAEGAYYDYKITKATCSPFSYGDAVASGTTKNTYAIVNLEESGDNDIFIFYLSARKDGRRIGSLMTHGGRGHGWDYRFRIK